MKKCVKVIGKGLSLDSLLDEAERINDVDETAQMFINALEIVEEAELYKEENEKSTLTEQVENLNKVLYTVDDSSIYNAITFGTKVNAASPSVTYNKWKE
ncbi:MAG: hypothetical protein Q4G58_00890 [bacterium]|nr:hypothetical protein [bacterium]